MPVFRAGDDALAEKALVALKGFQRTSKGGGVGGGEVDVNDFIDAKEFVMLPVPRRFETTFAILLLASRSHFYLPISRSFP